MHCHHERALRERRLPSRADAAWQREFDRIEEVSHRYALYHTLHAWIAMQADAPTVQPFVCNAGTTYAAHSVSRATTTTGLANVMLRDIAPNVAWVIEGVVKDFAACTARDGAKHHEQAGARGVACMALRR